MSCAQILIVEDEGLVAEDIKSHVEENNWNVAAIVPSGEAALEILQGIHADLIMMDIVLKGTLDGIQTAEIIRDQYQIPVVFLTAYTDPDKIERASKTSPYGYLVKPFDERELKTTVSIALSKANVDQTIKANKHWANAVLNSIEDGVITTDITAHIHDINPKACDLLQIKSENSLQQLLTEILVFENPSTQQNFINTLDNIINSHQHTEQRIEGKLKSIENRIIDAKLSNITFEDGSTNGIVLTFHDVTMEHRARENLNKHNLELEQRVKERTSEIKTALDKAQTAIIAKDRFLANISHELRTPLNPISTLSQMMMLEKIPANKHRDLAESIYLSSLTLVDMIDNLIMLSEIDQDNFVIEENPFNPATLINDCIRKFISQATEKNIGIETDLPDNITESYLGNYSLLLKVLEHLTDNAMKFTDHGAIIMSLTTLKDDKDSTTFRFSVKDTGSGISDNIANELFERFTKDDNSWATASDGMGIGLSLSKLIIEQMGGRIKARNRKNGGAEVWFDLNLKYSNTQTV